MMRDRSHLIAGIQALFVVFLWATSWVLIKIGLKEIPALTFAGLRYSLAFICLLPVLWLSRRGNGFGQLSKGLWLRLFLLGLLFYAITQGASFIALSFMPAVTVNLMWSFSSVTVAVLGVLFLAENPTFVQWLGVVLATIGAVVYFYPATFADNQFAGILAAVIGVLANGFASILGRDVNRTGRTHPLLITVISMGIGAILLLGSGIIFQGFPEISLQNWAIIAWLAVINTAFAFTLWNYTLRRLSATESSIINGTMIIWIPVLAVLFLDERVSTKEFVGLIIVGFGTLLVQMGKSGLSVKKKGPIQT